jgi:hypothetical protein
MRAFSVCRCFLAATIASFLPLLAVAHGLLLDAESKGDTIFGSAYYSNGEKAVNESIALLDITEPGSAAINARTDAAGDFTFQVTASHRYRLTVYGDEGHSVEIELTAGTEATPRLIDADAEPNAEFSPPPAWAIVGGLLLLSLVPALVLRSRPAPMGRIAN